MAVSVELLRTAVAVTAAVQPGLCAVVPYDMQHVPFTAIRTIHSHHFTVTGNQLHPLVWLVSSDHSIYHLQSHVISSSAVASLATRASLTAFNQLPTSARQLHLHFHSAGCSPKFDESSETRGTTGPSRCSTAHMSHTGNVGTTEAAEDEAEVAQQKIQCFASSAP